MLQIESRCPAIYSDVLITLPSVVQFRTSFIRIQQRIFLFNLINKQPLGLIFRRLLETNPVVLGSTPNHVVEMFISKENSYDVNCLVSFCFKDIPGSANSSLIFHVIGIMQLYLKDNPAWKVWLHVIYGRMQLYLKDNPAWKVWLHVIYGRGWTTKIHKDCIYNNNNNNNLYWVQI